jgi:hypothetical protein
LRGSAANRHGIDAPASRTFTADAIAVPDKLQTGRENSLSRIFTRGERMKIHALTSLFPATRNTAETAPARSSGAAGRYAEGMPNTGKVTQIMRNYDLHNMSYGELEKMTRELEKAGAIPDGHLLDYLPPPQGEFTMTGQGLAFADSGKTDFLRNLDNHLAYVEKYQASDFHTVFQVRRMADFYHNLDALESAGKR